MAQDVQVGAAHIRVVAKTLAADYQRFKREWQEGLEQALSGVNITQPIISNQQAQQQGQTAGTQIAQGAASGVSSNASQVTAPIAATGNGVGADLGRGIVAGVIAAGTGKLIAAGLGNAMELESSSGKLQAQLGLSKEDAARYGAVTGQLYGEAWGESMEDVEGAVGAVISSIDGMRDASDEALTDVTRKVLTLSDAFGLDAARSAQVLGQAVSSGLVADIEEGADLLTSSLQAVPANLREDVIDALDEYGPFLAGIGIKGEQAFGLITAASEKGAYGIDKTGDALKELTIRATDMSTASVEAYTAAGLNADEMSRKILAGGESSGEAFSEIASSLLAMEDPVAQATAAIGLFGTPLEDLGVQNIPTFLQSLQQTNDVLGETTGAAKEAGDALSDNMASNLESVKRQFGQTLGEIALPLLQAMLPMVQDLAKFFSENRDMIVAIGGPLLVIGGIIATIVAAMSAYSVVAGVLGPAIGAITAAQWTWNAALFVNPLTLWILAISAIIALIAVLILNWDAVVSFMTDSINWISEQLGKLGSMFSDLFSGVGDFFSGGGFNIGFSSAGLPQFANGGLIPATPGGYTGTFGEAGQNEIVMNEGLYNQQAEGTVKLLNNINNGGSTTNGKTQINHFNIEDGDPRKIEAAVTNRWNRMDGI